MYKYAIGEPTDLNEHFAICKPLADKGNLDAMNDLGVMYIEGFGDDERDESFMKWLYDAGNQGHAIAQYNLGMFSINCFWEVGPKYREKAVIWFQKAASQNLAEGQLALGTLYERGLGVFQDIKEAIRLYNLAAEKGVALAQLYLGSAYMEKREYKLAEKWLISAADKEIASAQNNLAELYYYGREVGKDIEKAKELLESASKGGLLMAKLNLGLIHLLENRIGVNRKNGLNEVLSAYVNRKLDVSCEHEAVIEYVLGMINELGMETDPDYKRAVEHYKSAFLCQPKRTEWPPMNICHFVEFYHDVSRFFMYGIQE